MIQNLLIKIYNKLIIGTKNKNTPSTMSLRSTIQSTLDLAFSLLCLGPLTVLFWRGTFNAITDIAFRDLPTFFSRWYPALILYLIGTTMKILVDLTKHSLRSILINKGPCLQSFSSMILVYLDAFFGVVMWVGGFNLLYVFPGLHWYGLTGVLLVASSILMVIKAFNSTGSVPLGISTDEFENVYNPNNYFGTKFENSCSYKVILDTIFSYTVVHTLVICCWWGMWELENRYILFPCEITVKDIQAWDSVIISYFLVFVVVAINNSVKEMREEDGQFSKTAAATFTAFLAFLAALNFWRGIWSLMDFYFFPSMSLWNNLLLSHIVGFLGTYIAGSSLTLTQSSEKDSNTPDFLSFQYWSKYGACGKKNHYEDLDQHSETTPLVNEV